MPNLQDLPSSSGTYILELYVEHSLSLTIGSLDQHQMAAGYCFYIGSARGAGGLRSRVGRHLRGDGAPHWHIDYLRAAAEVREVYYMVTDRTLECEWSRALAQLSAAFIPVPHFGASDCRSGCEAHLVAFPRRADVAHVRRLLGQITSTPIVSLRFR